MGVIFTEAVRANTQRLYTNQTQGTSFNQLLLEIAKKERYYKDFVNEWIQKFGIGDELEIKRIKGIATEIIIRKGDKMQDLADLGYGITQFLPILLKVVFNFRLKGDELAQFAWPEEDTIPTIIHPNGPLFLIEEPETNLQSKLADFLVDVAQKFHITLLVETHSEYLIRRLQVLTAEKGIKPEDSVIYYLHDPNNIPEGQEQVKKINIEEDGGLTDDFGSGFFDEATNAKIQLVKSKNTARNNKNSN